MTNEFNPDGKDIRFIDSHYKDLFRIPDGSCIQIHYPDETVVKPCKFIDEYHTRIGTNVFHICQFAEIILKILNLVILILSFLPFFTDRKPTGPESSPDIMSIFTISLRCSEY